MRLLLPFLAFLGLLLHVEGSGCPSSDWTLDIPTSFCYRIGPQKLSFDDAKAYCQGVGGNLTSVTTSTEQASLARLTNGMFIPPWSGTYRTTLTSSIWNNVDGQYAYTYSYWSAGEPGDNGACAVFKSNPDTNGLATAPCDSLQQPLCKYKPIICPTATTVTGIAGNITSPNYPNNYYNSLNCKWIIKSSFNNTFISLTFNTYNVDVPYDYVTIYNGNSTLSSDKIGQYNNLSMKNSFDSTSPMMTLVFHTDTTGTDKGWWATWNAIPDYPDVVQTGTTGSMSSPNYPQNYDNFIDQSYYVTTTAGMRVNATFDFFLTENRYDVLTIYDGPSIGGSSPMIANLTGTDVTVPYSLVTSSNHLSMRFVTDRSIQKQGWHMNWFGF